MLRIKQLVAIAKKAVEDKKGIEPVIINFKKSSSFTSCFLIVHGTSSRHMQTIAEHVKDELESREIAALHIEGMHDGKWILVDFGELVLHVFHHETRKFYDIERLWRAVPSKIKKPHARKN